MAVSFIYRSVPPPRFGPALTDLLYARNGANPSAKLTFSLPQKDEDVRHFRTKTGTTVYTERSAIGHRYFQQEKIIPAYSFGYGLSYTPVVFTVSPKAGNTFYWTGVGSEKWTVKNICMSVVPDNDKTSKKRSFLPTTETIQIYFQRKDKKYRELIGF